MSQLKIFVAYMVHAFTALGAVLGLLTLYAIYKQEYILTFWYMAGTIVIDAVDGTLARLVDIKKIAPRIDGELLDNIIDYLNYVITPAFFLMTADLLPPSWILVVPALVVLASAYQFTQSDAKTADHFFKGFPDYWNIVVFYLFVWHTSPQLNVWLLLALVVLVFVPIKYVYPSRMEYVTGSNNLRHILLLATILWGIVTAAMLVTYPQINPWFNYYSFGYCAFYALLSLYRTFIPMNR